MIIERPNLNKADPMANIAMIDTWIARTADKLNYYWPQLRKQVEAAGKSGGTDDYDDLTDKPRINGHVLQGDKSSSELGLVPGTVDPITNAELAEILV